ncbi:endonuclease/exonuclease/phosphatase family protein [Parapedobacter sp. 10938]|uniref:endonuclease/exonuclease/phosphatase family protein n=1 Tax=Parapedobacter flavus TaxID=3110225 RepID=UPI002DB9885C|nr:endonuclease/exonuclease/phosphatase family protein [Parapedobacter sp. 10938]MEC3880092.1 endonuclease/exonuclease/phosphatase family protein [Parapedobacter sp. 10938]
MNWKTLLIAAGTVIGYLCTGCNGSGGEASPEKTEKVYTIRVLTYNIFHGETSTGMIDMDLFADIIKSESPDIVALQEVDKGASRSGRLDITAELASRTGLTGYFGSFRPFQGGEYGAAILSAYPVHDFRTIPTISDNIALLFARIEIDKDVYIHFNSSHLSTDLAENANQVQQLTDYYLEALASEPLLICGDLNAEATDDQMQPLWAHFSESDTGMGFTFSTRTGMRKKIDFLLHPKTAAWEVVSTKRICNAKASDHCAVLAVLNYKVTQ